MTEQTLKAAPIKSSDRLGFTVFIAILLHVVIILGVAFEYEDEARPPLTDMEVIFIQNFTESDKSDADYLAQVTQQGGGNTEERLRPKSPPPSELPSDNPNLSPAQQVEMIAASEAKPVQEQLVKEIDELADLVKQQTQDLDIPQGLTAQQLVQRSMEIASLNAELSDAWETYSEIPRKKYISAATKEYVAAAYMSSWQDKVERIGSITARQKNIHGSLVIEVDIKPDGSVHGIIILQSSGKPALDAAAMDIINLAKPFAPFPEALKKETDILAIIRTWQFQEGGLATK